MRNAALKRETKETQIQLSVELDGKGKSQIDSGCGFLNHMLELMAFHGQFDLILSCRGDTQVDDHHTVEDIAICLGEAFAKALGDKKGIGRYGNFLLPMDETLVLCAVDLSGRDALGYQVNIPSQKVGNFDTELVQEFMASFARNIRASIHFYQLAGTNSHHIIEAMFKGLGRCLKQAIAIDTARANETPSSKGVL